MAKRRCLLKPDQRVQIEIKQAGNLVRYSSRVESVDDQEIVLEAPISKRELILLEPGTQVNIWFGDYTAIYFLSSEVTRNISGEPPMIGVNNKDKPEEIQKREFVRARAVIEVMLSYYLENGRFHSARYYTRDISGGGLMVTGKEEWGLDINSEVNVEFCLEGELMASQGVVIWKSSENDARGAARGIYGIRFTDIFEKDRQKIIKYVFKRQIENRRKGLRM